MGESRLFMRAAYWGFISSLCAALSSFGGGWLTDAICLGGLLVCAVLIFKSVFPFGWLPKVLMLAWWANILSTNMHVASNGMNASSGVSLFLNPLGLFFVGWLLGRSLSKETDAEPATRHMDGDAAARAEWDRKIDELLRAVEAAYTVKVAQEASWRKVLGLGAGEVSMEDMNRAYRAKAMELHKAGKGDSPTMVKLNLARDEARRKLGA